MTRKIEEYELTAYALGELDEERAREVAAELKVNEAARRTVEEILETSVLLGDELKKEPTVELDEPRVAAIQVPKKRRWVRTALIVAPMAAAAAVVFVVVPSSFQDAQYRSKEGSELIAVNEPVVVAPVTTDVPENGYTSPWVAKEPASGETAELPSFIPLPSSNEHGSMKKPSLAYAQHAAQDPYVSGLRESRHSAVVENAFHNVRENPLSTFSIDVDTAAYAILRRYLHQNQLPPKDAVRIEEMINYFTYDLPEPKGAPIAVHVDVTDAPWRADHLLARVALKAREVSKRERPRLNLVFLIDVSGSMSPADRLPLLVEGLNMLVDSLRERDRVAVVVYAGAGGVVLPSTEGERKREIRAALRRLSSGGSTNGEAGIQLAYQIAAEHFIDGGINRVILATDGDFNVGTRSDEELVSLIQKKAESGVFLTVLGVGVGNYNDSALEKLADEGNGNYAYLDSAAEAKKVLVDQGAGTLHAVAKDVKIQIELNPARISSYRLLGYENRALRAEEFNDDRVDAGEIGAGHTVTALYELVPAGAEKSLVDPLKYQARALTPASESGDLFTVKLRYKEPDGHESRMIERAVHESQGHYQNGSADLKFAAAVAGFGMLLRDSPHKGSATYESMRELAESGLGRDPKGDRAELVSLILAADRLTQRMLPEPFVRGLLPSWAIERVFRENRGSVVACYEKSQKAGERLEGALIMRATIAPSGEVSNTTVESTPFHKTQLGKCVARQIRRWRFPVFKGEPKVILVPFLLADLEGESQRSGFLDVGARPWATITIDGKRWPYPTPQAAIELAPGKHTVVLTNPETGVTKTMEVDIEAGATRTLNADMRAK